MAKTTRPDVSRSMRCTTSGRRCLRTQMQHELVLNRCRILLTLERHRKQPGGLFTTSAHHPRRRSATLRAGAVFPARSRAGRARIAHGPRQQSPRRISRRRFFVDEDSTARQRLPHDHEPTRPAARELVENSPLAASSTVHSVLATVDDPDTGLRRTLYVGRYRAPAFSQTGGVLGTAPGWAGCCDESSKTIHDGGIGNGHAMLLTTLSNDLADAVASAAPSVVRFMVVGVLRVESSISKTSCPRVHARWAAKTVCTCDAPTAWCSTRNSLVGTRQPAWRAARRWIGHECAASERNRAARQASGQRHRAPWSNNDLASAESWRSSADRWRWWTTTCDRRSHPHDRTDARRIQAGGASSTPPADWHRNSRGNPRARGRFPRASCVSRLSRCSNTVNSSADTWASPGSRSICLKRSGRLTIGMMRRWSSASRLPVSAAAGASLATC